MNKSALNSCIDAFLETEEQTTQRRERKANRKKKLIEEQIAIAIASRNKEKAVMLAEKYEIPPQEFAKMVLKYSCGQPISNDGCIGNYWVEE